MMFDPESRIETIFEHLNTAVIQLNPNLEVLYLNPSAEMLLEKSIRQTRGRSLRQFCATESGLIALLKSVLAKKQPVMRREFKLHLASGNSPIVNLTASPAPEPGLLVEIQPIGHLYAISRDVQRQEEYTATRNLIRRLAHEIKNPLGGIRGAAQLLEYELPDPELREYTTIIVKETDRLKKLIDQMAGPRSIPSPQRLNIHEVVEHVRKLLAAESATAIILKIDYDPSLPGLVADRDQLVQAVLNIARNAFEALDGQGEIIFKTRILRNHTIEGIRRPLVARLTIEDNGPGIPEALQAQIFFPMVTGKPSGTGLGLSIAQSLVTANGGRVNFKSGPNRTIFEILLPIQTQHELQARNTLDR